MLYPHGILFLDFNPRSHEGSDVCIRVAGYTITYFNPRSHEGSDFSWGSIAVMYTRISIHAPTRGATSPGEDSPLLNTISIHAPTRGATSFRALQTFANGFQSTLPRGERLYVWVAGCTITYFNPRSHEGSDDKRFYKKEFQHISIHAPTRGATAIVPHVSKRFRFQSTLPRGERRVTARISWTCGEFQSTLPRGERHGGRERCTGNARFQSTLPRGERRECQQIYPILLGISIHAPTRGATNI